jgi:acyl carrier protein
MGTFEKVKEIVINSLSCDDADVTMEASIKEDLGADSLDAVELIMSLEDAFSVTIPTEKASELNTVGEVVEMIDSLK